MPFSTISYNSESFLKNVLDDLIKCKILEFYFYVPHIAEDDEGGRKDHIHVFMRPCGTVKTEDLIEKFKEYDFSDLNKKPLACLPFKSSKTDDAILYFLHDKSYLAFKGQSRKYHYTIDNVVTSDKDEYNFLYKSVDMSAITPYKKMLDAQELNMDFNTYFKTTYIPIQQITNYQKAWYLLLSEKVERNGNKGHDILENDFISSIDENGVVTFK